ncbi:MAG TPA: TIGR03435 family protein [Bryobacteraceae bacterium]|jgi:uncharacterized protein (TIGR03435 family)|nr:TIGR03435 family protein [Bryobacteraceae bacterium]
MPTEWWRRLQPVKNFHALLAVRRLCSGSRIGAAVLGVLAIAGARIPNWIAFAQTPRPAFEIASIKPGTPDDPLRFRLEPGGRYLVSGASLRTLIADAYDIREYQVSGVPAWGKSGRFSIEAKTSAPIPPWPESNKLLAQMVQSLLEDRFRLAVHRETRQDTIYNLVVAKSGFKLKTASPDAPAGFEMEPGRIHSLAVPLEYLAGSLANVLERPVYDKTGIAGKYDYWLTYTPDDAPAPDPAVPSIFTAVEQQLGLRLESAKGPVETVVIDHVEQLNAN